MTINGQTITTWFGQVCGTILSIGRPLALAAGVLLALAIGVDFKVWDVPHIAASQGEMLLAALLIWAGK